MALTTTNQIKAILGVPDTTTSDDLQYEALRTAAERVIKNYLHRDLESQSYTHFFSGNNTNRLILRQTPVTSITSLHLDSGGYYGKGTTPFPASTLLTEGEDYVLDYDETSSSSKTGIVWRIDNVWPMSPRYPNYRVLAPDFGPALGNVKVVYVAGYTTIPEDVQYAVALLVAWMKRNAPLGGNVMLKERLGDYAYEIARKRFDSDFEMGNLRATLAPYREFGW